MVVSNWNKNINIWWKNKLKLKNKIRKAALATEWNNFYLERLKLNQNKKYLTLYKITTYKKKKAN